MTAKVQLRMCGPMDHLRIAWQTGETLLESIPFREDPEGTRYNVLLAVQEMLTNVLRHAYRGDQEMPVVIDFEANERGMWVELRDRGPRFDPSEVYADLPPEGMPKDDGGYGIMIAKVVMDELEYTREDDWNVLRMFKSVQPSDSVVPRS